MKFIQHDLGYRRDSEIVEITLAGNTANVAHSTATGATAYARATA